MCKLIIKSLQLKNQLNTETGDGRVILAGFIDFGEAGMCGIERVDRVGMLGSEMLPI